MSTRLEPYTWIALLLVSSLTFLGEATSIAQRDHTKIFVTSMEDSLYLAAAQSMQECGYTFEAGVLECRCIVDKGLKEVRLAA